jgi:hypothetical protein
MSVGAGAGQVVPAPLRFGIRAGLRTVAVIPVASLRLSERPVLLPVWLVEPVEQRIGGWRALAGIAQDVIYVCAPAHVPQAQSNSSPSHSNSSRL